MYPRILVISNYKSVNPSRPEAEMFIEMAKRGVPITIFTYPDAHYYIDRFEAAGIRVIPFHPVTKWSSTETLRIREELQTGGYDIMHLYNSRAMLHGLKAAKGLPVKVVLYRGYAGNIHWYDPTAYFKYLHPRADAVICITEEIRALIDRQNWYRKGIAIHIPKGHDPAWYADVQPADLTQYGIPKGSFTIACMANNRPFKDIPTLLKAALTFTQHEDVYLLLIGQDMDTPENRAIFQDTPAAQKIRFSGFTPEPLPLLKACQIKALTSYTGEAITKSVLEAMSLGLTPVITDIAGNRHLIDHGHNGLLVPSRQPALFAAAITSLVNDRPRCAAMGRAAQSFMQQEMHIQRTVDLTLDFYQRLLHRE